MEFFEKYKKLDALCGDMFSCKNGVSEYITSMESRGLDGFKQIESWDDFYRTLKHLRWIRNKIAHESSEDEPVCKPQDILLLNEVYNQLIDRSDPLALISKKSAKSKKPVRKPAAKAPCTAPKSESVGSGIIIMLVLVAAVIAVICYFTK